MAIKRGSTGKLSFRSVFVLHGVFCLQPTVQLRFNSKGCLVSVESYVVQRERTFMAAESKSVSAFHREIPLKLL